MPDAHEPYSETWLKSEPFVKRFEDAWRTGARPAIEAHLPEDAALCRAVLPELARLDLEYRMKSGCEISVEEYCRRFPDLRDDRAAMLGLIADEFEWRRRRGHDVSVAEYLERFPQYGPDLEGRLSEAEASRGDAVAAKRDSSAGTPDTASSSLLAKVKLRDQDAWTRFCQIYGPLVYGWARKVGLQDSDAADVGQEVFRTAAARIDTFRRDRSRAGVRSWLWTITRNKVGDHLRRLAKPEAATATRSTFEPTSTAWAPPCTNS